MIKQQIKLSKMKKILMVIYHEKSVSGPLHILPVNPLTLNKKRPNAASAGENPAAVAILARFEIHNTAVPHVTQVVSIHEKKSSTKCYL